MPSPHPRQAAGPAPGPGPGAVTLTLTPAEALVLNDLLQRFSSTGTLALEDQAEERALWNLCCLLERELVAPFTAGHADQLADARRQLRDPD